MQQSTSSFLYKEIVIMMQQNTSSCLKEIIRQQNMSSCLYKGFMILHNTKYFENPVFIAALPSSNAHGIQHFLPDSLYVKLLSCDQAHHNGTPCICWYGSSLLPLGHGAGDIAAGVWTQLVSVAISAFFLLIGNMNKGKKKYRQFRPVLRWDGF